MKSLPKEFTGGLVVVIIISIAKLYDNALGNNNAILFNSDYYRMVLLFGLFLTLAAIIFNLAFIPVLGINGSAIATFLAIGIYNTIKISYVKQKFKMQPFTSASVKVVLLIGCFSLLFYFWDFPFQPLINIGLKSTLVGVIYFMVIYKLNISDDISIQIKKYLGF
jgi:O-antigen/teichoic acid export membrane protein